MSPLARAALFILAVVASQAAAAPPKPRPAQIGVGDPAVGLIVAFDARSATAAASSSVLQTLSARAGVSLVKGRTSARGVVVYDFAQPLTQAEALQAAARVATVPGVRYAVPNRVVRSQQVLIINDPLWALQWHYASPNAVPGGIDLTQAWNISRGSSSIVVAVIDTGIRGGHPDLQGRLLPGYDFVAENTAWAAAYGISPTWLAADGDGRDADPTDPGTYLTAEDIAALPAPLRSVLGTTPRDSSWHGTHVAGTIAANVNSLGGVGVDRAARVLPVRALGKAGIGLSSDILDAMLWAAGFAVPGVPANPTPAHVLNLSLGAQGACDAAYQDVIDTIVASGRHVVVASGNESSAVTAPANCRGVIAVTAHARDGDNAWYANVGPEVVISAPGGGCGFKSWNPLSRFCTSTDDGVLSTWNLGKTAATVDDYGMLAGTSMATPHVSGVVALMLSLSPTLTPAEVRSILRSSARPHPPGTTCAENSFCGAGLLDALRALTHVRDNQPTVDLGADLVVAPATETTLTAQVVVAAGRSPTTYRWRQTYGPSLALVDTAQSRLRFITPATGRFGFELAVTDNAGYRGTDMVNVRVNSPPVIRPLQNETRTVGQYLALPVRATDVDGDNITFVVTSLPPGAHFDTLTSTLIWSPSAPATGVFTVYATDGLANSDPVSATITFEAASSPGEGGAGAAHWLAVLTAAGLLLLRRNRA